MTKIKKIDLKINKTFGPHIGYCNLPEELIKDFNNDCDSIIKDKDKVKRHDHSDSLVGNVKQELLITPQVFSKYMKLFNDLVWAYFDYHKNSHGFDKLRYDSAWYVRQYAGDFNPLHVHTNCHISVIGYLKQPDGMIKEWEKEDQDHYPSAGYTEFHYGEAAMFNVNTVRVKPEVGLFYIFPSWMAHMVYPFRSEGERRTFSFNVLAAKTPKKDAPEPR
jgi:uncharacterized protein (TIGR02466 family)